VKIAINFDDYITAVENDLLRSIILKEYQPTRIHHDTASVQTARPALSYLLVWLASESRWLTVLGDYGVGKSWMLKRLLYDLIEKYKSSPTTSYLPFFIPLQDLPKAFDYENLILKTFTRYGLSGVHYDAF
jgi:DNA replication protein DnaC